MKSRSYCPLGGASNLWAAFPIKTKKGTPGEQGR